MKHDEHIDYASLNYGVNGEDMKERCHDIVMYCPCMILEGMMKAQNFLFKTTFVCAWVRSSPLILA
jgi:hypothetical protein